MRSAGGVSHSLADEAAGPTQYWWVVKKAAVWGRDMLGRKVESTLSEWHDR